MKQCHFFPKLADLTRCYSFIRAFGPSPMEEDLVHVQFNRRKSSPCPRCARSRTSSKIPKTFRVAQFRFPEAEQARSREMSNDSEGEKQEKKQGLKRKKRIESTKTLSLISKRGDEQTESSLIRFVLLLCRPPFRLEKKSRHGEESTAGENSAKINTLRLLCCSASGHADDVAMPR